MPNVVEEATVPVVPVALLDHRIVSKGSSPVSQLLVQWSALPSDLATWEEVHDISRRFPDAPAWGQAGFRGGGSVMSLRAMAS